MADLPHESMRLLKPFELGLQVAEGRRRAKISQADFARKLGVSRKTISDLERGAAEHVSLKTALAAMALAGFALYSAYRRPPTMEEIMARRAADRARAESLLSSGTPERAGPLTGTGAGAASPLRSSPQRSSPPRSSSPRSSSPFPPRSSPPPSSSATKPRPRKRSA